MKNINFDDGLKSFTVNSDENRVICFNPGDLNLFVRMEEFQKHCEDWMGKIEGIPLTPEGQPVDDTIKGTEIMKDFDAFLRKEINYIFNADVYDTIFNGQSPLSTVGGKKEYLFEAFFRATMPYIQEEMDAFSNASQKRIEKYTKGYQK